MNIIGKMKIWFGISALTIVIGVGSILVNKLNFGIDFTGGSLLEISLPKNINKDEIQKIITEQKIDLNSITPAGEGSYIIRTKPIEEKQKNELVKKINEKNNQGNDKIEEKRFETIGPTVSADLVKKAILSVIFASLAIVLYIAFAFRKLSDHNLSWRFGTTAVVALIHDLLVTVGLFAIFGKIFNWEVDSLFITALLTVMGFSVHDTIVVFDRIRENLRRSPGLPFATIVNNSVIQTLARSLNTSLTILIALVSLLIFGGENLRPFVFTLFVGILVGTYSSIFIASPAVVVWQNKINKRIAIAK